MKIKIEDYEEKIFSKVLECAMMFFKGSTPRVAGGWVRDKIMGCQSFDLDIALDGVSGYEFAQRLRESNLDETSSAGLVKCNPEKSKHLETAVLNIDGHFIDFVNLRKETYTSTRIPKIEFGTPYEDAHRRDLTINALFYNIETQEIEDFTGKGLDDLEKRIIKTPLDPETTFKDDPLRILRIFRFYSKFGFSISDEIYEALKNEELKKQIRNKVSKERINIELFKMINYPMGHLGIFEIIKNGYVECIFDLEDKCKITYEESKAFFLKLLEVLNCFKDDDVSFDSSYSTVLLRGCQISQDSLMETDVSISFNNTYSFINLRNPQPPTVGVKSESIINQVKDTESLLALAIPEKFQDMRWIFNLYLILNKFAKKQITVKKKLTFLNLKIVKHSLLCSNEIAEVVNSIERGLMILSKMDLSDQSLYNLFFVSFYLKDLWFETLVLELVMRKKEDEEVRRFIMAIKREGIPNKIVFKSPLDVSTFKELLEIESTQISYFSAESVIFKLSHPEITNEILIKHLKDNKEEIIAKHSSLK